MIVYAYYGMGKTTLQNAHKDVFIDIDEEYVMSEFNYEIEAIKTYIEHLSKDHIVLINGRLLMLDIPIDIAFIPENVDITIERLKTRGTDDSFVNFVKESFDENMQWVKEKCKSIIVLNKDEYLSDYTDMILRKEENIWQH